MAAVISRTKRFVRVETAMIPIFRAFDDWFTVPEAFRKVSQKDAVDCTYSMIAQVLKYLVSINEVKEEKTSRATRFLYTGVTRSSAPIPSPEAQNDSPSELLKTRVLSNAISQLVALGCSFAIIDHNGLKHGTLELAEPKTGRQSSRWREINEEILATLRGLNIGDIHEFKTPEGEDITAFFSAINYRAEKVLGKNLPNDNTYDIEVSKAGNAIVVMKIKDREDI